LKKFNKPLETNNHEKNINHDKEERNDLVLQYLPLAKSMAKNARSLPFEDATQEAVMGLIRAAEGYDKGHGTAFSTYAKYWIIDALQRAAIKELPVHVPSGIAKQALACERQNIDYAKKRRSQKKNIHSKSDEHSFINAHPISVKPATDAAHDESAWLEISAHQLLELSTDEKYSSIDYATIKDHLNRLSILQRRAVYMRFYSDMTLEEIGNIMGNSREAVRQLINRGLDSLKMSLNISLN
jgi:RNA polymerase sigma factor (sigma-70 family)